MNELGLLDEWLYAQLAANATITAQCGTRIYRSLAPDSATEPLIVFEPESPEDVRAVPGTRLQVNAGYTVRAITRGDSYATAYTIADAIDTALHSVNGTQSGRAIASVRRSPLSYVTTEKDTRFNHAGGIYDLVISGS